MKYFTDDLWSKFNSSSENERHEARIEWDKNNKEYFDIFQSIKPRLSKKFLNIYLNNHGFHDFQIKNVVLTHKEYGFKNPVSVELYITDSVDTFKITYKCIKKFKIDYEQAASSEERGFDDWGYDEFLPVNEQILSHEILFASGSTMLIHFKNRNLFVSKVKEI